LNKKREAVNHIILSAIGMIIILVMAFLPSHDPPVIADSGLFIVGTAFIIVCSSGFILALKPNLMRQFKWRSGDSIDGVKDRNVKVNFRGHHPDCNRFEVHTIKINSKVHCAGCTGLAIGSVISIILMSVCLVFQVDMAERTLKLFITGGLIIIIFNYTETIVTTRIALLHVISNAALITGLFAVVFGTFKLSGSAIYGIFGIILSLLFLYTRIRLSSWRHSKICDLCSEDCRVY